MAVTVISTDLKDVASRLPSEKLARRVMARAINRGLTAGRVQAAREAVKNYAIKQKQVNEKARVRRTKPSELEAELTFSGPALNIADFDVKPKKPQPAKRPILRATIGKSSGQRPYKGAFLIPVRSGTVKAFRREGKDRLPIKPVYGPSIPTLVGGEKVREAVQERVAEVVLTRLSHEINRELEKGK